MLASEYSDRADAAIPQMLDADQESAVNELRKSGVKFDAALQNAISRFFVEYNKHRERRSAF